MNFQDETFNEQLNVEENFGRKRSADEHHIQTYTTSGKRLRIISEASLATALNEEEDDLEEEVQPVRTTKRVDSHNLQPKLESLEFLDEAAQQMQQAQQQSNKQPQNITYLNMDSFTEKTSTVPAQQPAQTRKLGCFTCSKRLLLTKYISEYIQAGTSQQQQQQTAADYKSGESYKSDNISKSMTK